MPGISACVMEGILSNIEAGVRNRNQWTEAWVLRELLTANQRRVTECQEGQRHPLVRFGGLGDTTTVTKAAEEEGGSFDKVQRRVRVLFG
jgi:hypothetical protein